MTAAVERRDVKGVEGAWGAWERMVPDLISKEDAAGQRMLEIHLRRYRIAGRLVAGKRVLDVACGTGYGSRILKDNEATSVTGVDLSMEAVEYARAKYGCEGIEFLTGNAEELSFAESFDVVTAFETIEHIQNPRKFLSLVHRHLKPNGQFMLSVPIGETRHIDGYHLHVFEREDVYRMLADAGFHAQAFRFDDWMVTRKEITQSQRIDPTSRVSIWKLLFTWRGQRVLRDVLFRNGIGLPMLMVSAQRSDEVPCPIVSESTLGSLEEA